MDGVTFHSDAPLRASIAQEGGERLLVRRLDPALAEEPAASQLFREEIEAAARLPRDSDTLLPPSRAVLEPEPVLARPFLAGTLEDRLAAEPPLTGTEILSCVSTLLRALETLEHLGLAHGDPGPRNLLLDPALGLRLADPVSSRRRYALIEASDPVAQTSLDRAAALELIRRWRPPAGDPLEAGIREIAGRPWEVERRLAALERLSPGTGLPISPGSAPVPARLAPVAVHLRLSAVVSASRREAVLAELAASAVPLPTDAAQKLARGTLTVLTTFPEPSLALTARLQAGGLSVDISSGPHAAAS